VARQDSGQLSGPRKTGQHELPAALVPLLAAIVDRQLAARLTGVLEASSRCIERLAAINLVALEPTDVDEGSADLTLWEKMAPVVGETVVAVNDLCEVIDVAFPTQGRNRESFLGEGPDQRAEFEAAAVFHAITPVLRREVVEVGNLVRRPELLASGWTLLAELQRLRSQLRSKVGEAVYLSAGALGASDRKAVVPGFAQEVQRALSFRGTEVAVRRRVRQRLEGTGAGPAVAFNVEQDFEALAVMPAWRHVKVETKRAMLHLRSKLKAMGPRSTLAEVRAMVEPMLEVLAFTSRELTLTVLVAVDRQARHLALVRAEQAELHLMLATGAGGWALESAFDAAQALRGTDERLDELLRRATNMSLGELAEEELMPLTAELARVLTHLAL
jgi:hypothetical protein